MLEQNRLTLWHQKLGCHHLANRPFLGFSCCPVFYSQGLFITHVLAALETVIEVKLGSCFTDSKVALFWIQGEGEEWKPFVLKEIQVSVSQSLVPLSRKGQSCQHPLSWCFTQGTGSKLALETWTRLVTQDHIREKRHRDNNATGMRRGNGQVSKRYSQFIVIYQVSWSW